MAAFLIVNMLKSFLLIVVLVVATAWVVRVQAQTEGEPTGGEKCGVECSPSCPQNCG